MKRDPTGEATSATGRLPRLPVLSGESEILLSHGDHGVTQASASNNRPDQMVRDYGSGIRQFYSST